MAWWVRNPEVVCTELEAGAVLLNMETRTYYSLNAAGLEIWRLVETVAGLDELGAELAGRFEATPERAIAGANSFLQGLEAAGLLVKPNGDAALQAAAVPPAARAGGDRQPFADPELIQHDEPLHEIPLAPFDPQLPLAE